ncbi:MAG: type I-D CRISPR-associated protein Cas5/Csc1 [Candidatus Sericytochromatia bacterium]
MIIYECFLTLHENTFFSSREINNFYQTEPLIGNYALAYALGFAKSEYNNKGEITYYRDLSELNDKNIYITPAKFIEKVKFTLTQFNSISDSYWYKMVNNAVSTNKEKDSRPINYPQIGWIKMLSIGNKARFYIISKNQIEIKKYIRLGKFMSKAKIEYKEYKMDNYIASSENTTINQILNPLDISKNYKLKNFDIYSINPVSLIDNVNIEGEFFTLKDTKLPIGMKFNVDFLKGVK